MSKIRKFRRKNDIADKSEDTYFEEYDADSDEYEDDPEEEYSVKDKSSRKKQSARKGQRVDLRTRIRRHRLLVFYRAILVAALIAAVAVICLIRIRNKVYSGYRVISEEMWTDNGSMDVLSYHGNVLSYSRDGAVCTSLKGKTVWNQPYEMQNPLVAVRDEYVAIGDYNGTKIYVMNTSGQQGIIDTRMPIRALDVSAKGTVLVVLDDAPVTRFSLFSKEGKLLWSNESTMSGTGYPIAISVSDNSKLIGVSYLYADGRKMASRVAYYNLGDVGDNYSDTLVSSFEYEDAVVPVIHFMNEENSFAVADNRLMLYSGKQIPSSTKEKILQREVRAVYYGEKYVGLVFLNLEGETNYKLEVYNTSGNLVHTYEYDMECKEILFQGHFVYIYNESECLIYDMKGKLKYQGEFDMPVMRLIPTSSDNKLILIGKKTICRVKLT